jgi:hypothetical protein
MYERKLKCSLLMFDSVKETLLYRFELLSYVFRVITPSRLVVDINISGEHTASIFSPEDGCSKFLRNV